MTRTSRRCTAGGDCDAGTLLTAPDCYEHTVQCIERCDTCERWPGDAEAAASVASRIATQPEFCWKRTHVHYIVVHRGRA